MLAAAILFVAGVMAGVEPSPASKPCALRGIPLYGRVQFVEDRPDLKIEVVKSRPDFRVRRVRTQTDPSTCGEWRIVKHHGTRVQIVRTNPDLRVQFVEESAGWPR